MNKFLCRLAGGHKYCSQNISLHCDKSEGEVHGLLIVNRCTRCGARKELFIPKANVELFREGILNVLDQ